MSWPFLFLGHGEGPGTVDLLVCLADPAAALEPLRERLRRWAVPGALVEIRGPLVDVNSKHKGDVHVSLTEALTALHDVAPIGLAVRKNRLKKASAWHLDSIAKPDAILAVLEKHVLACRERPYEAIDLQLSNSASVHLGAWEALEGQAPLGGFIRGTLALVTAALKKQPRALAVWHDLLVSRLPGWTGFDFGADVAVLEQLSKVQAIAPTTVEMPGHFKDAFDEMVKRQHARRSHRFEAPKIDWSHLEAVRAAMSGERWSDLQWSLHETEPAHIKTVLELSPAERAELSRHERLATMLMNIATMKMTSGEFVSALEIYDSVIDGKLEAAAAANPLYAAADDNNKLGINEARARRYLAKCMPLGPKNAAIFLNAACLVAELGDFDEALRLLAESKRHGYPVRDHRNEQIFVPLRDRPAFKKLMT